ncbi:uncharacterized protein LOC113562821 [Ooceraea biroi]|uniref:uncharacterized protein LOC113562821 n=1 Tax=Ooceraea biroi TaxID=2015173 RepID=UPI000F07686C|nr:uncharacterized protein LOC113562821 [Ooceraea biroi]
MSKPSQPGGRPSAKGPKSPRSPKTAAVVITAADGDYKGAVERAQKGVDIDALGIAAPRVRRALKGAPIYEIPGPESATKADELASRLEKVFEGSRVRVTRPLKKVELRVRRLDDAATVELVSRAVAAAGGCDPCDVDVRPIQRSSDGLGTSWIRLPACLRRGHVQATCLSQEDRQDLCYKCGAAGHRARGCAADPKCPLCTGLGKRADHSLGGAACAPPSKGVKSGDQRRAEMRTRVAPSARAAPKSLPADGGKGGSAPPREKEPKLQRVAREKGKSKGKGKDKDKDEKGSEEAAIDVE